MAATGKIKKGLKVPVVGVGRITNPDEAEAWLAEGRFDFVGMARALVADPNWANKALGVSRSVFVHVLEQTGVCRVSSLRHRLAIHNPSAGQELELDENGLPSQPN